MSLPAILKNNLSLPAVASPLFIISSKELVVAQCKAGVVGSFPSLNARGDDSFESWLQYINKELDEYNAENLDKPAAPYAVNLIVHSSNPRIEEDLALCVKYQVPIIITSLGAREDINQAVQSYGGITLHDVINNTFAKKAIAKGANGLIAVATGAGGHAGTISPFALIQEIREWFDGPLLLSGCIATGDSVLAAQAMGADLAYIGSPFIATTEANAVDDYKNMVAECSSDDILYSKVFTGVFGNYLTPSVTAAGLNVDEVVGDVDAAAMNFGDSNTKAWKNIWGCGQGISPVKEVVPAGVRVEKMVAEYAAAKQRVVGL